MSTTDPTEAARLRRQRDEDMMAEVRASGGTTGDGMAIIILHTIGSKTGNIHLKPVCVGVDGDDLIVAATAGGQPRHPQWYPNLVANPDLEVEYMGEQFRVHAETVPNGPDRDRLYALMVAEIPGAYGYQDRCRETRQIPIVRLSRLP